MRILLLIPLLAALAACATLSDSAIMARTCSHQIVTRDAANAALKVAETIANPVVKQAMIDQANRDLDRLKACPPIAVPASP